jgi:small multidrug resistance family-3 protein
MNVIAWFVFAVAALLEVGSDAIIRRGLRGHRFALILAGCAALACYGLLVNSVRWEFSRLLGVYVGFFALVGVLFGRFVFRENIPLTTWFGLALIIAGGLMIQFGQRCRIP